MHQQDKSIRNKTEEKRKKYFRYPEDYYEDGINSEMRTTLSRHLTMHFKKHSSSPIVYICNDNPVFIYVWHL